MMKKYLLVCLSLFCLISCITVPKTAINNFMVTHCFDGKKTELEKLLNIKGFYYIGNLNDSITAGEYLFYDNGFTEWSAGEYWLKQNFEDVKYGSYGEYNIFKDTIKIKMISNPVRMGVYGYKVWFKIIDYHTIELIYWGHSNKVTTTDIQEFKVEIESNSFYKKRGAIYKFHPLKSKPNINKTYIMNKKWFWCNKEDYKEWKDAN